MADVEEDDDDAAEELCELRLYSRRKDVGEVTLCCRSVICNRKLNYYSNRLVTIDLSKLGGPYFSHISDRLPIGKT